MPAGSDEPPLVTAPAAHRDARSAAPHASTSATPRPGPKRQADVRDKINGMVLPESDPVSMTIARIGVRSKLVDLGLNADGSLEVPADPADAGWFSRGAAPGALGPAVVAGHVTWNGAPAIFYRLGALDRGDQVLITRQDRRTAAFRVDKVVRYAKSRFPSRAVYGPIDHAGLRLITCGGSYDAARHRYLDNVVVFARLVSVREARG